MPSAHKLPSGKYRVQLTVEGQRISVTGTTKKEAEYKASEILMGIKRQAVVGMSVGEAIDAYIDSKDGILSPTTIQSYRKIRKNDVQELMPIPIKRLDKRMVQRVFNDEAKRIHKGKTISPKTLRNIWCLVSASIRFQDPSFHMDISLPAKQKHIVDLIDPAVIFRIVKGTDIELPVVLAMWLSFSLSEIRGLTCDSVGKDTVTVRQSMVDIDGVPVVKKSTKAYNRTRTVSCPQYIMDLIHGTDAWKNGNGFLVDLNGQAIYWRWTKLLRDNGLPPMSFHKLRHLNASVMMALGVPDTYAMTRGGWSSRQTLNTVYQHTLESNTQSYDERINSFFDSCAISCADSCAACADLCAEKVKNPL